MEDYRPFSDIDNIFCGKVEVKAACPECVGSAVSVALQPSCGGTVGTDGRVLSPWP